MSITERGSFRLSASSKRRKTKDLRFGLILPDHQLTFWVSFLLTRKSLSAVIASEPGTVRLASFSRFGYRLVIREQRLPVPSVRMRQQRKRYHYEAASFPLSETDLGPEGLHQLKHRGRGSISRGILRSRLLGEDAFWKTNSELTWCDVPL